jgi:hypothetical protein
VATTSTSSVAEIEMTRVEIRFSGSGVSGVDHSVT